MAAMLRDSVIVVVRMRPRAIPLAMITMRKSTHGFPFLSPIWVGYGAPLSWLAVNNLIAWKVDLVFVYRELHNLSAIHPPPCARTVVTTVTYSQHDKCSSDWEKITISFEVGTYSTLSTSFYQFYANFLSSIYKNLQQKIVDHYLSIGFLFYISYIIVSLLLLFS